MNMNMNNYKYPKICNFLTKINNLSINNEIIYNEKGQNKKQSKEKGQGKGNSLTDQENNIYNLLIDNNFIELPKNNKKIIDLDDGIYFIHNPEGSQKSPDFRIFENDKIFNIELKSSKSSSRITLNDHRIIDDFIYIFSIMDP